MATSILYNSARGTRYELDKEIRTGDYWIDGSPIYVKVRYFEKNTLPNSNTKTYSLDIPNIKLLINSTFTAKNSTGFLLNDLHDGMSMNFELQENQIKMIGKGNWLDFEMFLTLFYTKVGGGN